MIRKIIFSGFLGLVPLTSMADGLCEGTQVAIYNETNSDMVVTGINSKNSSLELPLGTVIPAYKNLIVDMHQDGSGELQGRIEIQSKANINRSVKLIYHYMDTSFVLFPTCLPLNPSSEDAKGFVVDSSLNIGQTVFKVYG